MAEHSDLISELEDVEKLSSAERLKNAKKRRHQQMKRWSDYEKKLEKQEKALNKRKSKANSVILQKKPTKVQKIKFDSSIMFLEAAARNDVNEVKYLLEQGVNPDVANEDGLTALHQCCIDDSRAMLDILMNFGANPNARDSELWTPLHAAATCGHLDICQKLINGNADLLAVNADGNMPYDICDDMQTLEFIETQMAEKGVSQELIDETRLTTEKKILSDIKEYEREGNSPSTWVDRVGATLLHIGAANGYYDVVSYLLTKRMDINAVDNDGWTPAHAAACWGHVAVLDLLAKSGADLERKTKNNEALLDLCEDTEVKQQIEEIKKEVKTNQEKIIRNGSRRRSGPNIRSHISSMYSSNSSLGDKNAFSSSVRRHSMREKHRMSVKEAREEARFRITLNTDSPADSAALADSPSPVDSTNTNSPPITNIDDIDVTSDDNVTTITVNGEDRKTLDDNKAALSPESTNTESSSITSQSSVKTKITDQEHKDVQPKAKRTSAVIQVPEDDKDVLEKKTPSVALNISDGPVIHYSSEEDEKAKEKQAYIDGCILPKPKNGHPSSLQEHQQHKLKPVKNRPGTAHPVHGTGEEPMKKYKACKDQVVGEEVSKGCCVIS